MATPLAWDELGSDVEPGDFTIASLWPRLDARGDFHRPVLEGGQDLREAMQAVGLDPDADDPPGHEAGSPSRGSRRTSRESRPAPREFRPAPRGSRPPRGEEPLTRYRERRDFTRTPEPAAGADADGVPAAPPPEPEHPRFVVHHHLATRLHHDLRLEHEGTAPSWAVPKGLPDVAGLRHLAVRTEDHPVEYLTFSGDIPAGEYGAGPVRIWDEGTYELLEWREDKVEVRLHGRRHRGTWHLFRTDADDPAQWLVVRVGDPEPSLPGLPPQLRPMLASDGGGRPFDDPGWQFEIKWDGVRAIATTGRPGAGEPGSTRLTSRAGNDLTPAYPEIASLWERVLARNAVLDGELVALSRDGRPSFQRLQRRMHVRETAAIERVRREVPVTYMVFDLLAVDGEPLVDVPLSERMTRLDQLLVPGERIRRSQAVVEQGTALHAAAQEHGLEGLVAKRLASAYRPGRRSDDWRKIKIRRRTTCVAVGWMPGEGGRVGHLGSLLAGQYDQGRLRYVGRVGTGFDEAELDYLGGLLAERAVDASPVAGGPAPPRGARWVRPDLVFRVEYGELTDEGVLRAPAYKGLIPDVDPRECVFGAPAAAEQPG